MSNSPSFYIEGIPVYKDFLSTSLPNYTGYFMDPEVIVAHETENYDTGANAEMHNKYLHNGAGGRGASWHFTVDDKCIWWHIPLDRNGWHAGDGANGKGNRKGIGIEHCENSDGDFKKTVQNGLALIRWIRKETKKNLPVEPHKKFSSWSKNCPGNILPYWDQYIKAVNKVEEAPKLPAPKNPKPHEPKLGEVYHGNSLVDYLNWTKEDSSFSNRKNLARQYGIKDYTGTAAQNMELLGLMRKGLPSRVDDKAKLSMDQIVSEVLAGKWGNGSDRVRRLTEAGYDPAMVQKHVNSSASPSPKITVKSIDQLVKEVNEGKWGNNPKRRENLIAAGYDADEIQRRINQGSAKPAQPTRTYTVRSGDTLSEIGQKLKVPWRTIAAKNNLRPPYTIRVGQKLKY